MLLNSVLSRKGEKLTKMDVTIFYSMTPMTDYECLRMKLADVPDEIIKGHKINSIKCDGWARLAHLKLEYWQALL